MPRVKKPAKYGPKRRQGRPGKTQSKYTPSVGPAKIGTSMSSLTNTLQPAHRTVKLRYAETFSLATGTSGVLGTAQLIYLNSLYDPNNTGGGHQPYLYDQMTNLYYKYRVDSVKVELIWNTIGATSDVCCVSQIVPSSALNIDIAGATIDRATEIGSCSTATLSPSGNTRSVKQVFNVNIAKIEGISKAKQRDDPGYAADYNASPANITVMKLLTGSYSGNAGVTAAVQVILTFKAKFFRLLTQTQS